MNILLVTLNTTYQHTAFGLRYLFANLDELQSQAKILEFAIEKNPRDIAEEILKHDPRIIGFSIYIWNTWQTLVLISILKKIAPNITLVLGGPEVSYESELQEICQIADYVIKGEGDFLFRDLCRKLFSNCRSEKYISDALPNIAEIKFPYIHYTEEDIRNRVIYVEASRGCPFKCEYCLSSLDSSVRNFPLDSFLSEMETLLQRGVRKFKFIDRTFNLNISISRQILEFFFKRMHLNLFIHFEMVPDRLPEELTQIIKQFPKGSLQFEIGVQTWNPTVAKLIGRRNDYNKVCENFIFLSEETEVHTHADLIVGLPGEDLNSFAEGFDKLYKIKPDEIQVGILKRLKGTPIVRHDFEWQMVYQTHSPFQVLSTKVMNYQTLQNMSRFSRFWDLIANSGQFPGFMAKLTSVYLIEIETEISSIFWKFYGLSSFLVQRHPQTHSIHLINLAESLFLFLQAKLNLQQVEAAQIIFNDYCNKGTRTLPNFLKPFIKNFI